MFFVHLPVAETRDDGSPIMNPYFGSAFTEKFVNKMSRVIIACQDGGGRSELAAKIVTDAGFTSIAVVAGALLRPAPSLPTRCAGADARERAGGMDAYLAASPLSDKDKKTRIAKVVQPDAGVKYGYGGGPNDSDVA